MWSWHRSDVHGRTVAAGAISRTSTVSHTGDAFSSAGHAIPTTIDLFHGARAGSSHAWKLPAGLTACTCTCTGRKSSTRTEASAGSDRRRETLGFRPVRKEALSTNKLRVGHARSSVQLTSSGETTLQIVNEAHGTVFLKWSPCEQQFMCDHRQGPEIRFWTMNVLLAEHFRSQILLGAAGESTGQGTTKSCTVLRGVHVSNAKVCKMGPSTFIKNDVLCKKEN